MNNNNNLTEQLLNSNDNSNSTPEELKIINYCLLTPIEKWKKFRKFPTKLLLHVILLISITVQIVFWSEQNAGRQATSNVYNAVRKLVLHKEEYDLEAPPYFVKLHLFKAIISTFMILFCTIT